MNGIWNLVLLELGALHLKASTLTTKPRHACFLAPWDDLLSYLKLFVDDPWMAAHQFLERNNLSQMFLDQVVDFIQKNTKGVTIGQQTAASGDPFTGERREIVQVQQAKTDSASPPEWEPPTKPIVFPPTADHWQVLGSYLRRVFSRVFSRVMHPFNFIVWSVTAKLEVF